MNTIEQQQSAKTNTEHEQTIPPPVETTSNRNYNQKKIIVLLLFIIFLTGIGIIAYKKINTYYISNTKTVSIPATPTFQETIITTQPPHVVIEATIGTTASGYKSAAGFSVTVTKVIPNPQVTGDPPVNGMQYVEIDLLVTNTSGEKSIFPGTFLFKSMKGTQYTYAGKNASVPGKEVLSTQTFDNMSTTPVYLLYQTVPNDHGKLIWYTGNDPQTASEVASFILF